MFRLQELEWRWYKEDWPYPPVDQSSYLTWVRSKKSPTFMFHLGRRPKVPSSFPEGSNIIRVLSGHPRTFCTSANIFHVRLGFQNTFFERLKSSFSLFLKGLAFLSWIRFHNNNNRFVHEHSLLMTLCLEASKMHPLLSLCSIFKNKHQKYLN